MLGQLTGLGTGGTGLCDEGEPVETVFPAGTGVPAQTRALFLAGSGVKAVRGEDIPRRHLMEGVVEIEDTATQFFPMAQAAHFGSRDSYSSSESASDPDENIDFFFSESSEEDDVRGSVENPDNHFIFEPLASDDEEAHAVPEAVDEVQLQDLVAAVRPPDKSPKEAPSAYPHGGLKASTSVGVSQPNVEVKQTSLTVPSSQPPLRRPASSQGTSSDEHPGGADSMDVCPSDSESLGRPCFNQQDDPAANNSSLQRREREPKRSFGPTKKEVTEQHITTVAF
ncbi:hypothetical protein MTO96_033153 [Rhipicephalus appendiculatus]